MQKRFWFGILGMLIWGLITLAFGGIAAIITVIIVLNYVVCDEIAMCIGGGLGLLFTSIGIIFAWMFWYWYKDKVDKWMRKKQQSEMHKQNST